MPSLDQVGGLFAMQAADRSAKGIASLRIDFRGMARVLATRPTTLEGLVVARSFLAGIDVWMRPALG